MIKTDSVLSLLALSMSLIVTPACAQNEKPPQSYADAMDAFSWADYKRAADHFRQAITERPSMVRAHYYLGLSLYNQELYSEALDAYQGLVKLDPNNILAHYQIAKIHLTSNDYSPAVEEYRWLKSLSEMKPDGPADSKVELLQDKPGEAINEQQKRYAGELAQYLLDLIPRETAEQYQLPVSQIASTSSPRALSCLKQAPRPIAPGDTLPNKKVESVTGGASQVEPMSASLRPTILYREKAKYSEIARINKLQGTVALIVVFSVEGKVTDIRVNRCLPDGLMQAAIAAAEKIRFNPAIKNGTPVSVRGTLEFSFNLY